MEFTVIMIAVILKIDQFIMYLLYASHCCKNFFAVTLILNYHLSISIIQRMKLSNLTKSPCLRNGRMRIWTQSDFRIYTLTPVLSSHFSSPNLEVVCLFTLVWKWLETTSIPLWLDFWAENAFLTVMLKTLLWQ